MTQRVGSVTGTVRGANGQAPTDYVVVAFASDSRKRGAYTRFVRTARPDQSGSFKLTGLPPEQYLLVALEYLESGDPELLEGLRAGTTGVSLAAGETRTIDLKLSR